MSPFQPIKTCTKTPGERVLGLLPSGRIVTIEASYSTPYAKREDGGHDAGEPVFSGYHEVTGDALIPQKPTHWMPFPVLGES